MKREKKNTRNQQISRYSTTYDKYGNEMSRVFIRLMVKRSQDTVTDEIHKRYQLKEKWLPAWSLSDLSIYICSLRWLRGALRRMLIRECLNLARWTGSALAVDMGAGPDPMEGAKSRGNGENEGRFLGKLSMEPATYLSGIVVKLASANVAENSVANARWQLADHATAEGDCYCYLSEPHQSSRGQTQPTSSLIPHRLDQIQHLKSRKGLKKKTKEPYSPRISGAPSGTDERNAMKKRERVKTWILTTTKNMEKNGDAEM